MRIGEEDFARNVGSVGAKQTASAVLLDPDGTVGLKVVDCTAQRMLQGAHRSLSCRSPAIEHPATMRMPRMRRESARRTITRSQQGRQSRSSIPA
jgi:hypothetical protein